MQKTIHISDAQVVMAFVATCIEATARKLGVSYRDVYQRMNRVGLIDNYIYPCYNSLHTESRDNVAQNLIECLKEWEEKA